MSLSAVVIALCFYVTMSQKNLTNMVVGSHVTEAGYKSLAVYAVFIVAVVVFLVALSPIAKSRNEKILLDSREKTTSKKTVIVSIICGLGIVFAIWFGYARLSDKKYLFISLVVLLLAMLPFFLSFEERKPKARDVVTVAVMCALAVTGRVAFSMLPNFSPVVAIVVISGVAFGCQGGFIVGAVTMLASNFIMGQGPWTPWQMFAMGMVGFFSGLVFKGTNVRRKNLTKLGLTIFGALLCIVVYGAIMNPASVLMWQGYVNLEMIAVSYITGFPFDLAQATATVAFLWIMARPFLEKLDRLRIKYGII
jgi:energy-coupling factor transport system ATP-binding protein